MAVCTLQTANTSLPRGERRPVQCKHWDVDLRRSPPRSPPVPVVTTSALQQLVDLKADLLREAKALILPPGPLDDLMDRLGECSASACETQYLKAPN
jgi:hypothetical protein